MHTSHVVSLVEIPRRQIGAFELKFHGIQDCVSSFMAFEKIMHSAPDRLSGSRHHEPQQARRRNQGRQQVSVATFCGFKASDRSTSYATCFALQRSGKAFHTEIVAQEFWQAQIDWLSVPKLPVHGLAGRPFHEPATTRKGGRSADSAKVAAAPGGSPDAYREVLMLDRRQALTPWRPTRLRTYIDRRRGLLSARRSGGKPTSLTWPATRDAGLVFSDTLRFITPFCQPSAFQNWPYRGLPDALTQYWIQPSEADPGEEGL